jgi:hypothetical protein
LALCGMFPGLKVLDDVRGYEKFSRFLYSELKHCKTDGLCDEVGIPRRGNASARFRREGEGNRGSKRELGIGNGRPWHVAGFDGGNTRDTLLFAQSIDQTESNKP